MAMARMDASDGRRCEPAQSHGIGYERNHHLRSAIQEVHQEKLDQHELSSFVANQKSGRPEIITGRPFA